MNSGRLFYEDEYDALQSMIGASGKSIKECANLLWPDMKPESAYAKLKDCLNQKGSERLRFSQVVLLMRFCGQYDPLYHACDETLHARPDRKTPSDEKVRLAETIQHAANTMEKALAQLERLQGQA